MNGSSKHRARLATRRRILLVAWLAGGAAILGRSFQLQVMEGARWRAEAERQQRKTKEIAAPRGRILDRDGEPMALSHEVFSVAVAPAELEDAGRVAELLSGALELPVATARKAVSSDRRWVVLPGRYGPSTREALAGVRGVYVERELRRSYPHEHLARGLLGTVRDGRGLGGVEEEMDGVLRGKPGREVLARDSEGRPIPGEVWVVQPPRAGRDVVLTVDMDLQEIAYEALSGALEKTGARGGDLVVTDPRTGELLAMVSLRDGREAPVLSAVNTPYEPGSIMKPFTVAGLLSRGLASLGDSLDTEGGAWTVAGRTIRDVHDAGRITLADAVRVSSNVGVAKAAQAFTPAEQYENLRDFGFGSPTGIALPGEAQGILRRPDRWSLQSSASLAIGYEISVTPLQMAMAYGALANGGRLMEPLLVRETRESDGEVLDRWSPRSVRQVVPGRVTRALSRVLVDVVEDGTGTAARLSSFEVAGKSGTSRAYARGGGYEAGGYFASFAAFFPADDPQLVVFVKLERPRGSYYGGSTAAPVTRSTLEAVLSVRRPPLDRGALASRARTGTGTGLARSAASEGPAPGRGGTGWGSRSSGALGGVRFAAAGAPAAGSPERRREGTLSPPPSASSDGIPVPELNGLPLRTAVRRLHALGLRVAIPRTGAVTGSKPAAGSRLAPGDTVRILTSGGASRE